MPRYCIRSDDFEAISYFLDYPYYNIQLNLLSSRHIPLYFYFPFSSISQRSPETIPLIPHFFPPFDLHPVQYHSILIFLPFFIVTLWNTPFTLSLFTVSLWLDCTEIRISLTFSVSTPRTVARGDAFFPRSFSVSARMIRSSSTRRTGSSNASWKIFLFTSLAYRPLFCFLHASPVSSTTLLSTLSSLGEEATFFASFYWLLLLLYPPLFVHLSFSTPNILPFIDSQWTRHFSFRYAWGNWRSWQSKYTRKRVNTQTMVLIKKGEVIRNIYVIFFTQRFSCLRYLTGYERIGMWLHLKKTKWNVKSIIHVVEGLAAVIQTEPREDWCTGYSRLAAGLMGLPTILAARARVCTAQGIKEGLP